MIEMKTPETEREWEMYYDLRYRILRQPWNQERGSERNEGDLTGQHFALWKNNEIVAIARADLSANEGEVQVRFVAVDTSQQGSGFGKKIMLEIEQSLRAQGVHKIVLHARENAVPFYLSLAYTLVEKSHLLFNEIQHFLMEKQLK